LELWWWSDELYRWRSMVYLRQSFR